MIHDPALDGLSAVDRSFLSAMAADNGDSHIAAIAQRIGVNTNYANQYRARLVAAELIEPAAERGHLRFALPYLREYLREHTVTRAWDDYQPSTPPPHTGPSL